MSKIIALLFLICLFLLPQTAQADIRYKLFLEDGLTVKTDSAEIKDIKSGTHLGLKLENDGELNWQAMIAWPSYEGGLSPRFSGGAHLKPFIRAIPNLFLDISALYQYNFDNDDHLVGVLLSPGYILSDAFDLSLNLNGGRYLKKEIEVIGVTLNLALTLPF